MKSIDKLAKENKCTKNDIAKQYFEEQGCQLIDDYEHTMKKMKYICKCGKESTISWNKFTQGKRCGYCGKNGRVKKYTYEEVENIFTKRGCKLLEKIYSNNLTRMKYICKCGRESYISLNGFLYQEQYCRECWREGNCGKNNSSWIEDREELKTRKLFRKKCYSMLYKSYKRVKKNKTSRTEYALGYSPKDLQEYI